jgi:hypothetical protein
LNKKVFFAWSGADGQNVGFVEVDHRSDKYLLELEIGYVTD